VFPNQLVLITSVVKQNLLIYPMTSPFYKIKLKNLLFSGSIFFALGAMQGCKKESKAPPTPTGPTAGLNVKRGNSNSAGIWTPLTHQPNYAFSSVMILLSDGTVAVKTTGPSNYGNVWLRLTPDSTGSYANGTWSTTIAPMNSTRHDFSSQLLPNGKLYVAGGEYGAGGSLAEVYDPIANTWTNTAVPAGKIIDASSALLNDGTVLQNFVSINGSTGCSIYNPSADTWSPTFYSLHSLDEGHWVQLPDQSLLNIDLGGKTAERYIPSLGKWIADANPVNNLYGPDGEMGAGFLLPNNRVFYMGANGNTTYYTPSGTQSPGVWAAGPGVPGGLGTDDGGAAFMVNGKIIYAVGPAPVTGTDYQSPTTFFEFDYTTNTYTQISAPGGGATYPHPTFYANFLQLPDGTLLFATMYSSNGFYIYTPAGNPIAAGIPTISNISKTTYGNYTITGTGFRGINTGAAYGDDSQPYTNYPIIQLISWHTGKVYYARTTSWTLTGSNSCNFTMPTTVPVGDWYWTSVTVNGFASDGTWVQY
jgi:hypothetical protein